MIRKEYTGPGAAGRQQRERAILVRIAGVPGVAHLVRGAERTAGADPTGPPVNLMEDGGSRCLATALHERALDLDEVLRLAVDLATILAALHRLGVVHRDINPANILLSEPSSRPILIDFDLADAPVEALGDPVRGNRVLGTLAYLSPEQTGRTARTVDNRSDLYSFGATLYELVTGAPPFGNGDALELTRDHLIRVPIAPAELSPTVPARLSALIMRLLEKEPDRRYQSAEGVLHDLRQIIEARATGREFLRPLGEQDFPSRLSPQGHLVGRESEIELLGATLEAVLAGAHRALLITGDPGLGKTALVNELRPRVAAAGGWFLPANFDRYHITSISDALPQILRGLAVMLLAEPETSLRELRTRIHHELGAGVRALVTAIPALRQAIGEPEPRPNQPDLGLDSATDPATAQAKLHQTGLELLATVASANRPVVVALDDLQWAPAAALAFADAAITSDRLPHVLIAAAYRDREEPLEPALRSMVDRWADLPEVLQVMRLDSLSLPDLTLLLAEMLRLPATAVTSLAEQVATRTSGNPRDAVELINTLRHDGLLVLAEDGWTWNSETLESGSEPGDLVDRLGLTISALPQPSQDALEVLACLGGTVELETLAIACGKATATLLQRLSPAVLDGLLIVEREPTTSVRFPHERIQQAVRRRMPPDRFAARQLTIARRLAPVPEQAVVAVEQYLPVLDTVMDPAELGAIVRLLRAAARQARFGANYALVDRYLATAARIMDNLPFDPELADLRVRLDLRWHAALHALGRFEQVDQLFERIQRECVDPLDRAEAAWVQISSLVNRGDPEGGLRLGLATLAELGHAAPTDPTALGVELSRGLDELRAWVATTDASADLARPEPSDRTVRALGRIIGRTLPTAYFCRSDLFVWLVLAAHRLWASQGPDRTLIGPLAVTALATIAARDDYETGRAMVSRVVLWGESRGYEPETSEARYQYAVSVGPWFGPLEESVRQARLARESLVREGDLQFAGYTYYASATQLLDCASTLDEVRVELESGLALARRTGNDFLVASLVAYQRAVHVLRGETTSPGPPSGADFDEVGYLSSIRNNQTAAAFYHITRGMVAAIFQDEAEVHRAVAAVRPLLPLVAALRCRVTYQIIRTMDLANQIRRARSHPAGVSDAAASLRELDECCDWMAARAQAYPDGFRHLLRLAQAERAWALRDISGSLRAYDQAQREVEQQQRPWHQALITERVGRRLLSQGVERAGCYALIEASTLYRNWQAIGKVRQLDEEFPFLKTIAPARTSVDSGRYASVSSETVDLLAVLRSSQAISSATNLVQLRGRVVDVLLGLTGATMVQLLVRRAESSEWFLTQPENLHEIPLPEAAARNLLPLSAFHYAERTRDPLLVDDAVRDDRFSRDPYLRGLPICSLMIVPIFTRGDPRGMLILENRQTRGAFSADRLGAVQLVTGQLSVSLDNALLYANLERKVAERTQQLREVNDQLERLAVTDALTGLFNRRHLMDVLAAEWKFSQGSRSSLAIAMIDVDHFKLYNDHRGHLAGDQCLRLVAAAIASSVRETDLLARYGGEEFAIILPGANLDLARAVAERVRQTVANLAEPHPLTPRGVVTISVGVAAVVPSEQVTLERLIAAADRALYQAKAAGRDRVRDGKVGNRHPT
jgi:diguanylate cyclase (GGDEF)-like protein